MEPLLRHPIRARRRGRRLRQLDLPESRPPAAWAHGVLVAILVLAVHAPDASAQTAGFSGEWVLDEERSTPADPWIRLDLTIQESPGEVTIKRGWYYTRGRSHIDSLTVSTDGTTRTLPLTHWADSRHLGAYVTRDSSRDVRAEMLDDGRTLLVDTRQVLRTSQGEAPVRVHAEYRLSSDEQTLTVLELRSTRPLPIRYVFHRRNSEE